MAQGSNTALEHALAEAALALTGLEVTLATLRDNGVIQTAQLTEILHRLSGLIDAFAREPTISGDALASTMRSRLNEMSAYLGVDLRSN